MFSCFLFIACDPLSLSVFLSVACFVLIGRSFSFVTLPACPWGAEITFLPFIFSLDVVKENQFGRVEIGKLK